MTEAAIQLANLGILTGSMLGIFVLCALTFCVMGRLEGYNFVYELSHNDNPALGIRFGLFSLAAVISLLGMLHPSQVGLQEDVNIIVGYGALAIGLLVLARYVNDKLILSGFPNNREVVEEKNIAVASVEGATYVATGLIIAGATSDWHGGVWVSLGWFVIGQTFLVILSLVYRATAWGVFNALDTHNHACGIAISGFLLSGGIALGNAVSGPFNGWSEELANVGIYLAGWLVAMATAGIIAQFLLVFVGRVRLLRSEILQDRNIAAGVIEASVFLAATLLFTKIW